MSSILQSPWIPLVILIVALLVIVAVSIALIGLYRRHKQQSDKRLNVHVMSE